MGLELKEPEYGMADREENICRIWVHYKPFYLILGSIVFVVAGIFIGLFLAQAIVIEQSFSAAMASLFPEAVGITFTVIFIDRLNDMRAQNQLKQQLIREIVSTDRGLVMRAFKELAVNNWITDGSLKEADLQNVVLSGCDLTYSNLKKANLKLANLSKSNLKKAKLNLANLYHADFSNASLEGATLEQVNAEGINFYSAYLWKAILRQSHLDGADFRNATLIDSDLQGAYLGSVDFRGANLTGAILKDAIIEDAIFDEKTKLPNGTYFNPKNGITQISEFV